MIYVLAFSIPILLLALLVAWTWMLCDTLRRERDYLWLYLLLLVPPLGMLGYVVNFAVLGDEQRGLTALRRRLAAERRAHQLEQMLQENPIPAHREELVAAYIEIERWDEALKHLKGVLEFDAESPRAQHQAAVALSRLGRTEQALGHYEYLYDEHFNYRQWRVAMEYARLLEASGRTDRALEVWRRIHGVFAIAEVSHELGRLLLARGEREEARRVLAKALADAAGDFNERRDAVWRDRIKGLLDGMSVGP